MQRLMIVDPQCQCDCGSASNTPVVFHRRCRGASVECSQEMVHTHVIELRLYDDLDDQIEK